MASHIGNDLGAHDDFTDEKQPRNGAKDAEKLREIIAAIDEKNVTSLRAFAMSKGGLLTDEARREAWPMLLGHDLANRLACRKETNPEQPDWRSLPPHPEEGQVHLDVERSFIYYPHDESLAQLKKRKIELGELIVEVLRRFPFLCYFQGYHDICQVFLLVLPAEQRNDAVVRLSLLRIRDFMLPTLDGALAQLALIPNIIKAVDIRLFQHLSQTRPYFALSDTLTMYAHNIEAYAEIARLFDVFLAKEAVFTVYMYAQIVLIRKHELFEISADEPDILHSILSKLPRPLDLERLIEDTAALMDRHPPEKLDNWSSVSRYSVLKTTQSIGEAAELTLEEGERCFYYHVRQLQRIEQRKKIRDALVKQKNPAIRIGLAVTVVIVAYWIRKDFSVLRSPLSIWHRLFSYR